jgi:hypothetical protein
VNEHYTLFVRAPDLGRVALIEDYGRFECIERHVAVGTWSLSLDMRTNAAKYLIRPGYGIEVRDSQGQLVIAGPMTTRKRDRDIGRNQLTVGGPDDMAQLAWRRAHPEPATPAPPYNVDEHDVRTGVASTVLGAYVDANAGPGALPQRQVQGLTIGSDPVLGADVTGRARWQELLELLQELATAGGVAFTLHQVDQELVFNVHEPADRSAVVRFSEELGNLGAYEYDSAVPPLTYVYLGGQGEGTARVIVEGQNAADIVDWQRIESFVDRRDTDDADELAQHIAKTLDENSTSASLTVEPLDTDRQQYRTHYALGDVVTAVIDDEPVQERVQQVRTVITAETATVQPTIGSLSRRGILRIFDQQRATNSRLNSLERR